MDLFPYINTWLLAYNGSDIPGMEDGIGKPRGRYGFAI